MSNALPKKYQRQAYPDGANFAFTIIDDTDCATVENVRPIYDYLYELGMRTTKTVWVLPTDELAAPFNRGQTLNDPEYVRFIKDLRQKGFEIASHGARGGSATRHEILDAFLKYEEIVGSAPRIFVNHARNKDNLYWGIHKLDFFIIKAIYRLLGIGANSYGHIPESEYFWGDYAKKHIAYVPKFSFHEINALKVNPLIPYFDPRRPYVNKWFNTAHGENVHGFNILLSKKNLDALEAEGGVCIVYTHFAYGFCEGGMLNPITRERLQDLASRKGWFVPACTILDFLGSSAERRIVLNMSERICLELRWVLSKYRSWPGWP